MFTLTLEDVKLWRVMAIHRSVNDEDPYGPVRTPQRWRAEVRRYDREDASRPIERLKKREGEDDLMRGVDAIAPNGGDAITVMHSHGTMPWSHKLSDPEIPSE